MIGCPVAWKCLVACRLGELSQQPTCPHSTHSRSSTQVPPVARQSWHPGWFALVIRIWSRWVQSSAMGGAPRGMRVVTSPAPTAAGGAAFRQADGRREADRVGEGDAAALHDQADRLVEQRQEAGAAVGAELVPWGRGEVVGAPLAGVAGGPAGLGQGAVGLQPAAGPQAGRRPRPTPRRTSRGTRAGTTRGAGRRRRPGRGPRSRRRRRRAGQATWPSPRNSRYRVAPCHRARWGSSGQPEGGVGGEQRAAGGVLALHGLAGEGGGLGRLRRARPRSPAAGRRAAPAPANRASSTLAGGANPQASGMARRTMRGWKL